MTPMRALARAAGRGGNGRLSLKLGRFGAFVGCTNYPECKFTRQLGAKPLGRFVGSAVGGVSPRLMGLGPVPAVRKLLARTGTDISQVDLVELNEAFASQSL